MRASGSGKSQSTFVLREPFSTKMITSANSLMILFYVKVIKIIVLKAFILKGEFLACTSLLGTNVVPELKMTDPAFEIILRIPCVQNSSSSKKKKKKKGLLRSSLTL